MVQGGSLKPWMYDPSAQLRNTAGKAKHVLCLLITRGRGSRRGGFTRHEFQAHMVPSPARFGSYFLAALSSEAT
jgi:hypothetical protein